MFLRNICNESMAKESKSKTIPWHFRHQSLILLDEDKLQIQEWYYIALFISLEAKQDVKGQQKIETNFASKLTQNVRET